MSFQLVKDVSDLFVCQVADWAYFCIYFLWNYYCPSSCYPLQFFRTQGLHWQVHYIRITTHHLCRPYVQFDRNSWCDHWPKDLVDKQFLLYTSCCKTGSGLWIWCSYCSISVLSWYCLWTVLCLCSSVFLLLLLLAKSGNLFCLRPGCVLGPQWRSVHCVCFQWVRRRKKCCLWPNWLIISVHFARNVFVGFHYSSFSFLLLQHPS